MPRKNLPRIVTVAPGDQPMALRVRWDKGEESLIDVSGIIQTFRVYAPLRKSPELFRQARVGEHGTDVVWTDEIDMAADTLWHLAQEQSGATMTADAFPHWRERKAYTLDEAARARPQSAHGRVLRKGRSSDPARRRTGDPSVGSGSYDVVAFSSTDEHVGHLRLESAVRICVCPSRRSRTKPSSSQKEKLAGAALTVTGLPVLLACASNCVARL